MIILKIQLILRPMKIFAAKVRTVTVAGIHKMLFEYCYVGCRLSSVCKARNAEKTIAFLGYFSCFEKRGIEF